MNLIFTVAVLLALCACQGNMLGIQYSPEISYEDSCFSANAIQCYEGTGGSYTLDDCGSDVSCLKVHCTSDGSTCKLLQTCAKHRHEL